MSKKLTGVLVLTALVSIVLMVNISAKSNQLNALETGQTAPDFTLTDINGEDHALSDYQGRYVVLEWTNYGCPYVRKHYDTKNMQSLQEKAKSMDVVWLSICSSAKGKQGYMSTSDWKKRVKEENVKSHAVLLDPKGKVGRQYGAKATPHMYVINPDGKLIYQGAIDDKPTAYKEDVEKANNYVLAALNQAKNGLPVKAAQTEAYGCSVKY